MIPSSDGDTAICIGTVIHIVGEKEPSKGRLLLFKAELDTRLSSNKRQLKQISDVHVKGCVYALARVNEYLAAAIGPAVSFFPSLSSARSATVTGLCIQSRRHGLPKDRGLVSQLLGYEPRGERIQVVRRRRDLLSVCHRPRRDRRW